MGMNNPGGGSATLEPYDAGATYPANSLYAEVQLLATYATTPVQTANQVLITTDVNGNPVYGTPQDLGTASDVTFRSLTGTTTNDSAAAGKIGEYMEATVASGSGVSLTTNTAATVTSLTCTPGEWDVETMGGFTAAGTTTLGTLVCGASLTTNTLPDELNQTTAVRTQVVTGGLTPRVVGPIRNVKVGSGTTTVVYLVVSAIFGVSTLTAFGKIRARRVR